MISKSLQPQFALEDKRLMSSKSWQKLFWSYKSIPVPINQLSEQNKILFD